ncbi:Potassium transporter [Mucor circinelloides]
MGCCGGDKPKWKREIVPDHKFENVDLDAFYNPSCGSRFGYMFIFILSLKSFAVYVADLWTAVSLLVIGQTTVTPAIPTEYSKWIFFACIMVSFLLLIWDMFKARRILKTHDISFAFTSVIANRYLSMKDYRYYCLFQSINSNSKGIDNYAFFIFFQLKGWKRLLLAEAPRQVINVVTLEALAPEWLKIHNGSVSFDNEVLGESLLQQILTGTMAFSVLVFAISFILVCAAAVLYIPLFCHIRGNLKEYCCHKVDKRISEILRKQGRHPAGKRRNHQAVAPESESFIDESGFYKRPLAATTSPSFASPSAYEYEKASYFQSPMMSSPGLQHQASTPVSEQRLLNNNDDGYYDEYQSGTEGSGVTINQQYFPRPVAHQLPFQNRSYGYYAPLNDASSMASSQRTQIANNSPVPSSTCLNEQRYQKRNYPHGY